MLNFEAAFHDFLKTHFESTRVISPKLFERKSDDINSGVDTLLKQASILGRAEERDEVPIEDLNFHLDTWLMEIRTKLSNGKLHNLRSAKREGNVKISLDGIGFGLMFPVKFENLEITFDRYDSSVFLFDLTGSVKVKVKNNVLEAHFKIPSFEDRPITGESLALILLRELGGVEVEVTGFGYFNFFVSKTLSWLAHTFNAQLITAVELKIAEYLPVKLTGL